MVSEKTKKYLLNKVSNLSDDLRECHDCEAVYKVELLGIFLEIIHELGLDK